MISDVSVDRFYYIFDSREQRALVVDRTTGEEVTWSTMPRVQLIDYVGEQRAARLRHFARWCARQVDVGLAPEDSKVGMLWSAVQSGEDAWAEARTDASQAVVRAAALGLPQGDQYAAQLLTVHACTHPDPFRAALDAAHMSERWVEFTAGPNAAQAVRHMRQRHVDWLLDSLREDRGTEGKRRAGDE